MPPPKQPLLSTQWLNKLKSTELHRLAVSLGTPCSGTKSLKVQGIEAALFKSKLKQTWTAQLRKQVEGNVGIKTVSRDFNNVKETRKDEIRLVSIDMGIRNLAYAVFSVPPSHVESGCNLPGNGLSVTLQSWQKIDVSSDSRRSSSDVSKSSSVMNKDLTIDDQDDNVGEEALSPTNVTAKDAFSPSVYATHAYNIMTSILALHNPTHVIIERQRFRTGGASAVQEWTIRVGVFEGMLWAVLKTLAGDGRQGSRYEGEVEAVLPQRVNRFWLEGDGDPLTGQSSSSNEKRVKVKTTGKDVKKAKIDVVKKMLEQSKKTKSTDDGDALTSIANTRHLTLELADDDMKETVNSFLRSQGKEKKSSTAKVEMKRRKGTTGSETPAGERFSKLDDLSDCFLQGLAWLQWQNNRTKVLQQGEAVLKMPSSLSVAPV